MQQTSFLIGGDAAKIAVCGAVWPEITTEKAKVTCKRCLTRIAKLERLAKMSRFSGSARHETWEGEAHQ